MEKSQLREEKKEQKKEEKERSPKPFQIFEPYYSFYAYSKDAEEFVTFINPLILEEKEQSIKMVNALKTMLFLHQETYQHTKTLSDHKSVSYDVIKRELDAACEAYEGVAKKEDEALKELHTVLRVDIEAPFLFRDFEKYDQIAHSYHEWIIHFHVGLMASVYGCQGRVKQLLKGESEETKEASHPALVFKEAEEGSSENDAYFQLVREAILFFASLDSSDISNDQISALFLKMKKEHDAICILEKIQAKCFELIQFRYERGKEIVYLYHTFATPLLETLELLEKQEELQEEKALKKQQLKEWLGDVRTNCRRRLILDQIAKIKIDELFAEYKTEYSNVSHEMASEKDKSITLSYRFRSLVDDYHKIGEIRVKQAKVLDTLYHEYEEILERAMQECEQAAKELDDHIPVIKKQEKPSVSHSVTMWRPSKQTNNIQCLDEVKRLMLKNT